jgi:hypothetical protein
MKSLYSIITQAERIDGHIHLFDHEGIINQSIIDVIKRCVCFSDISFKYIDKYKGDNMISLYDKFINRYYDPTIHTLLATGENAEDIISIYKKYPDKIKGFGELKCYSEYIHGELPYGNLDWINPVLEYNKDLGLPVYIHYNLEDIERVVNFTSILKKYDFPIILCHCGMYDDCDNDLIHETLIELMKTYNNLYVDVSYSAVNYYLNNLNKLLEFDNKKVIIGTDINPVIYRQMDNPIEHSLKLYDKFYKLHRLGNFNIAIKNIFAPK